ncbi:hypothetical protein D3C72_2139040 [compost metagenome]
MACISSGASLKSWKRVLPSAGSTAKSSSFQLSTGLLARWRRGLSALAAGLSWLTTAAAAVLPLSPAGSWVLAVRLGCSCLRSPLRGVAGEAGVLVGLGCSPSALPNIFLSALSTVISSIG